MPNSRVPPPDLSAGGDPIIRPASLGSSAPVVSFAIASYNSAPFLREAVASALAQRGVAVEVLIVDDHSTDGGDRLGQALAEADPRVSYRQTPVNGGPGAARNVAFDHARGTWLAMLDSDDLLHPDRSRRLLAEAEAAGADLIADDLLLFDDARALPSQLFFDRARARGLQWITLPDYLDETRMYGRRPNLGFLKPMIRRDFLDRHALRYDEALRVAEDDALVIACLTAGARYRLLPQPLYFYRKHGSSITHRLNPAHIDAMQAASERLLAEPALDTPATRRPLRRRAAAMRRAWAFTHLVAELKQRRWAAAARLLAAEPGAALLLRQPIAARLRRLLPARPRAAMAVSPGHGGAASARPVAAIVSRQRITGANNGSSAYLLALAAGLRDAGHDVHLLQPAQVFGRLPWLRLAPEMAVFARHRIAGTIRIGDRLFARDPSIAWHAGVGMAVRLARRCGLRRWRERFAPYTISVPWQRHDLRFIADQAGLRPGVVLADYAFQVEALPYLIAPTAHSGVVMHDLFHTRSGQFAGTDSVATLDEASELAMLGGAGAVLCIQAAEAEYVARHLPGTQALLVPMPVTPVAAPAPGDPDRLLFVGSNTAPNILGLRWFLDAVWPLLASARPSLRLDVAGSVRAAIGEVPAGVRMLGLVDDLTPHYTDAGVVISPLLQGSGLKIKLVEALARGKAAVATGVTLQGVEWLAPAAVVRADLAEDFADAILRLAANDAARTALASAALAAAQAHFSPDRAFAQLRRWLESPPSIDATLPAG